MKRDREKEREREREKEREKEKEGERDSCRERDGDRKKDCVYVLREIEIVCMRERLYMYVLERETERETVCD